MKILNDISLKKYTTIKIAGVAKELFFPQSEKDLNDWFKKNKNSPLYILGGGSNLLINDEKIFEKVLCLKELDTRIIKLEDGRYYVGASVFLPKFIKTINKDGFGGIEYLFSVPALIGGAIFMNAGRGKKYNLSISDYIEDVIVYDYALNEKKVYKKEECYFGYRNSRFKNEKSIILGANFKFDSFPIEELDQKRKERVSLAKKTQDSRGGYNFGSVFKKNNKYIMKLVKILPIGYKNGVSFSSKTSNWLINKGDGTFKQAIKLINFVEILHKILFLKIEKEIIIWE
ncbi:MAG: FAD-binding protein [Campylobacter sp.]|nr:FAD-binding protein [Campylobacter sp.]